LRSAARSFAWVVVSVAVVHRKSPKSVREGGARVRRPRERGGPDFLEFRSVEIEFYSVEPTAIVAFTRQRRFTGRNHLHSGRLRTILTPTETTWTDTSVDYI